MMQNRINEYLWHVKKNVSYVVAIRVHATQPILLHYTEEERQLALTTFWLANGLPTTSVHIWHNGVLTGTRTFTETDYFYWKKEGELLY